MKTLRGFKQGILMGLGITFPLYIGFLLVQALGTLTANPGESLTAQKRNDLVNSLTGESRISPTLLNGWVNYNSGHEPVGYMKDALGFVHIKGFIKSGSIGYGVCIFNLPFGYRPSNYQVFSVASNDVGTRVDVTASGCVYSVNGSNNYLSLAGISFKATQ